jgi:hypothetical protein
MEHIGCVLHTDFNDFYDHELGATTCSHALSLERYQSRKLPIALQIKHLSDANIKHEALRTVAEQLDAFQQFGHELATAKEFLEMMLLIIYNGNGEPELCSYLQAQQGDQTRLSMQFIPTSTAGSKVLTYVQMGSLSLWLRRESKDSWKAGHGHCTTETVAVCNHLSPKHLRNLPHALFSIDFLVLKDRLIAVNYDTAPNLRKLGVEQSFSAQEVANAIMDRLDNSESPEPARPEDPL